MGKGAILPVLIDFQKPNDGSQQYNRRFHKEISLFLYPRTVQVEHDGIGTFVCVRYVRHKGRIDRIAAMRLSRIIEVDDIELRLYLVGIQMMKQVIISNLGKVWELLIIDIHRKALFNLLLDVVVHDSVGLTRTRCSKYH